MDLRQKGKKPRDREGEEAPDLGNLSLPLLLTETRGTSTQLIKIKCLQTPGVFPQVVSNKDVKTAKQVTYMGPECL